LARSARSNSSTCAARVAIVGFDNFDTADLLDPPLTVVAHDIVELGRRAAERLFARVAGNSDPPVTEVLSTTLIPRGSGEIPASRRASVARTPGR
jgi:LacI family transcriptional regulator